MVHGIIKTLTRRGDKHEQRKIERLTEISILKMEKKDTLLVDVNHGIDIIMSLKTGINTMILFNIRLFDILRQHNL